MPIHISAFLPVLLLGWPASSDAEIFRCAAEDGELTFSQTPCSSSTLMVRTLPGRREEKATDCQYAPRSASPRKIKSSANTSLKESRTAQQAARRAAREKERQERQRCRDRIRSQIDRINSRMRSGYSASQGIRLRERRRELERRMREC